MPLSKAELAAIKPNVGMTRRYGWPYYFLRAVMRPPLESDEWIEVVW